MKYYCNQCKNLMIERGFDYIKLKFYICMKCIVGNWINIYTHKNTFNKVYKRKIK